MSAMAQKIAAARTGGKGTPRQKGRKRPTTGSNTQAAHNAAADKKLAGELKKIGAHPIPAIQEVNLFRRDGSVIHVPTPTVQASVAASTFVVSGQAVEKEISELIPGILDQLGQISISNLKKITEMYRGPAAAAEGASQADEDDDDSHIPQLVSNFENVAVSSSA